MQNLKSRHYSCIRLIIVTLILLITSGCISTLVDPSQCPAGTQQLEGCPPLYAIEDDFIQKIYTERASNFAEQLSFDPIVYGRYADIPVVTAKIKFIDSSDYGARSALATRIWLIEQAQHTIDVLYYIFRDDLAGHAILGALCDAVKRGVDIRIMVDSMGSSSLDKNNLRALMSCALDGGFIKNAEGSVTIHKARVQAAIFNSGMKLFSNPNRRSHDKLIVIDGQFPGKAFAITGGRNISLDYFGILEDGSPNYHSYRDSDILLNGPEFYEEKLSLGYVVDTYYSVLFLYDKNKDLKMTRMRDPAQAYATRKENFKQSLASIKALPVMQPHFSNMDSYLSQGVYTAPVRLAHELGNLINKNVVSKAVENLQDSPNSIINLLDKLGQDDYQQITIVSPYLFASSYKDKDGNEIDGAANLLAWLEQHPQSNIVIVTNSVLTSDNFSTQAVIDMDLVPRLLMSEALQIQWSKKLDDSELNPELIESEEWKQIVNHPRLAIYETGKMDDVLFGGDQHYSKLHAKYVAGDDTGFVGTSNFDYRSRLYNNEMGFFFQSEEFAEDLARNTEYLISLSYRWGSQEWLEMRQRMREMSGFKASTVRNQRRIYKTLDATGLIWWF